MSAEHVCQRSGDVVAYCPVVDVDSFTRFGRVILAKAIPVCYLFQRNT